LMVYPILVHSGFARVDAVDLAGLPPFSDRVLRFNTRRQRRCCWPACGCRRCFLVLWRCCCLAC
jgi:hypothetical protein